jgi:hypothetical protein
MMNDLDKVIEGALMLGFIDLGGDEYKCTKKQLITLCAIVASETANQVKEQNNVQS